MKGNYERIGTLGLARRATPLGGGGSKTPKANHRRPLPFVNRPLWFFAERSEARNVGKHTCFRMVLCASTVMGESLNESWDEEVDGGVSQSARETQGDSGQQFCIKF